MRELNHHAMNKHTASGTTLVIEVIQTIRDVHASGSNSLVVIRSTGNLEVAVLAQSSGATIWKYGAAYLAASVDGRDADTDGVEVEVIVRAIAAERVGGGGRSAYVMGVCDVS